MKLCWWCSHEIPTTSLQLPTSFDRVTKKFSGIGQFCTISCVKAFGLNSSFSLINKNNVHNLITMLVQESQPDAALNIQAAPPWMCLQAFGGTMSIEEFRCARQDVQFEFPPIERITYDVDKKTRTETTVIKESSLTIDERFESQPKVINNPLKIKTSTSSDAGSESILCLLSRQSS
jgi:hypothetical protein